jgi:hypothetical protein
MWIEVIASELQLEVVDSKGLVTVTKSGSFALDSPKIHINVDVSGVLPRHVKLLIIKELGPMCPCPGGRAITPLFVFSKEKKNKDRRNGSMKETYRTLVVRSYPRHGHKRPKLFRM